MLSTITSTPIEEVNESLGRPSLYQLYPTTKWDVTKQILRRVEAAGSKVLVLTVDVPVSNRETLSRFIRQDLRVCASCHQGMDEDIKTQTYV